MDNTYPFKSKISPEQMQQVPRLVKTMIGEDKFTEDFVNCPLHVCEAHDIKGLYLKARAGTIAHFTGISASYEPPFHPHIKVKTNLESIDELLHKPVRYVAPLLQVHAKPKTAAIVS
ncbi:adenylyl-sulfate kinase [uncultured Pontibacter sp.]|uniref:adenylyl-sulfate kinase n=1 Tax=uncultured Pontibacter sp. TaxID=453356 RepID=UPI00260441BD|nr:adenylyl-sulfate kinase [uncultured Pontibacter sp.]